MISRRRSNMSANTPAGRARKNTGDMLAAWTRATRVSAAGWLDQQPLRAHRLHPGADQAAQLGQPQHPEDPDPQRRPRRLHHRPARAAAVASVIRPPYRGDHPRPAQDELILGEGEIDRRRSADSASPLPLQLGGSVQPGRQQTCQRWSRVRDPASRDGSGRRRDSQRRVHRADRTGDRGLRRTSLRHDPMYGYGSSSTSPSRHRPAINDPTTAVGCLDDRRCAVFGQPAPAAGLRIQQRVAPALARRRGPRRTGDPYCRTRATRRSRAGCRRC